MVIGELRLVGSDAALFRRAAAIVRDGGDIADDADLQADGLDGADGRFTTCAGTLDADFDFLQTVAHGLAAGILRDHLGGVGGAFAGALEADFASAGPADDGAVLVRDGDDRVIKSSEDVGDAAEYVFAALCLDDFRLLYGIWIEREVSLTGSAAGAASSFFAFLAFGALGAAGAGGAASVATAVAAGAATSGAAAVTGASAAAGASSLAALGAFGFFSADCSSDIMNLG